ncbi:hypothetical protein UlMin_000285 [Ulmus minor]
MIRSYPSIFELFSIPWPPTPFNATNYKSVISETLAIKLQKLLMLSSHQHVPLSKLFHLAPDLGLPPNFHCCTSYGHALELVSWDANMANTLASLEAELLGFIVDRPLKFKQLRFPKGLKVNRHHSDFLIKFGEMSDHFGLSNKLRGLIVRHLDLFYVSLKAQRDLVITNGREFLLMKLVREGKRMWRERRKAWINNTEIGSCNNNRDDDDDDYSYDAM